MSTEKGKKTRFFKNASGAIVPVVNCINCIWGVLLPDDSEKWFCSLYEKATTTEEAKQGFPDFCELPTEDDLVITKEPGKGFALSRVCELLNEALALDALAVDNIITNHVVCNKALADHPTIQVRKTFGERYTTSILGILNGLSDGTQYLVAQYDPNSGVLTGFDVVGHETIDTLESVSKIEEKLDS